MTEKQTEELLAGEGWEVECWSPLELRHADGSFATNQAARLVIDSLTRETGIEDMLCALRDIEATARLAEAASKDKFEGRLWREVRARASSVTGG